MEISLYSDYSFRVLMFLAQNGDDLTQIRTMSEAYKVSENHLIKVVQHLVRLGYVKSVRGRAGGVKLAMDPSEINLGEVFKRTEPNLRLLTCFDLPTNSCPIAQMCQLQKFFDLALQAFIAQLQQGTLADIVSLPREFRSALQLQPLNEA